MLKSQKIDWGKRVDDLNNLCYTNGIQTEKHSFAGVVQLVECLLAKEKVVGSSPIARFVMTLATWPSGKARVCKTLIMGSNPIVAFFCFKGVLQADAV
jgi:hypothetical protein